MIIATQPEIRLRHVIRLGVFERICCILKSFKIRYAWCLCLVGTQTADHGDASGGLVADFHLYVGAERQVQVDAGSRAINPMWSSIEASTPGCAYVTMRRAMAPATWRINTSLAFVGAYDYSAALIFRALT